MKAWNMARLAGPVGVLACVVAVAGSAGAQARRDSLTLYEFPDYRGASVTFYADAPQVGSTGFTDRAQSAQVIGTWRLCSGGGFRNHCEVLSSNVRNLAAFGLSRQVGSAQRLSGQAAAPPPYAPPATAYPRAPQPYPTPAEPYADYQRPYAGQPGAPAYDERGPGPAGPGGYRPYPDYAPPALNAPGRADGRDLDRDYGSGTAPGLELFEGQGSVFFPRPHVRGVEVSAVGVRAADVFCREQGLGAALYFDSSRRASRSIGPDGRMTGPGPVLGDVLCRQVRAR
jgi:hypothetical protein